MKWKIKFFVFWFFLLVIYCSFNNPTTTGTETPNFVKGVVYNEQFNSIVGQKIEVKNIRLNSKGYKILYIDTVVSDRNGNFFIPEFENPTIISAVNNGAAAQRVFYDKKNISLKLGNKIILKGRVLNDPNVSIGLLGSGKWVRLNKNNEYVIADVSPGIYPIVFLDSACANLLWVSVDGKTDTVFIKDAKFTKKEDLITAKETGWSGDSVNILNVKYVNYGIDNTPVWYNNKNFDGASYINNGFESTISTIDSMINLAKIATKNALGYGKYTTGGRGGDVYVISNLNDDNKPGSFRYAISQKGKRIISFDVAGDIDLISPMKIEQGDVTILGQTSPGGITLKNYGMVIKSNNVICSYLKIRPGVTETEDGIWVSGGKNVYIYHCNVSWTRDEAVSVTNLSDSVSIVSCVLSQGLFQPIDSVDAKSVAMLVEGSHVSILNNVFSSYVKGIGINDISSSIEIENNIFYNFGEFAINTESGSYINIENNYFKPSNATMPTFKNKFIRIYAKYGFVYENNNLLFNSDYIPLTLENIYGDYINSLTDNDNILCENYLGKIDVDTLLSYCGSYRYRDTYDSLIIEGVKNAKVIGTSVNYNEYSGIDKNTGIIDRPSDVGGWPVLNVSIALTDKDSDGIDDQWEDANGLNSAAYSDSKLISKNGLSNIENYSLSLER